MRRPRYAPLPTAAARQPNSESPGSAGLSWIGETGFEPATARPPAGCATRLRHSPYVALQAGDGNRTRPRSLEGFCATTTLRPHGGRAQSYPRGRDCLGKHVSGNTGRMQIPGVHIETLHNPVRYTYAQI